MTRVIYDYRYETARGVNDAMHAEDLGPEMKAWMREKNERDRRDDKRRRWYFIAGWLGGAFFASALIVFGAWVASR